MNDEKKADCRLRLMSFNIWGNCPKGTTISNRDDLEAEVILRYMPDAVGMQECSPLMRGEEINISRLLEREYTEVPALATNEKKNNYTPIFYRPATLHLLDFGWKYYAGPNDSGSKTITWALFETKESEKRFLMLNTHFYWTGNELGRAARVSNTGEMLTLTVELREKYPCPVFFAGDFNCNSDSVPIDVMRKFGLVESRYAAREGSPWRSHHAYPKYNPELLSFGEGTHPTDEHGRSIDHIFSLGELVTESFVTVVDTEALDASDHCPIFADFVI